MASIITASAILQSVKLFDSSESDSTDEEEENILICSTKKIVIPRARCKNYMEIIDSFTDNDFKRHFRQVNYKLIFLIYIEYIIA